MLSKELLEAIIEEHGCKAVYKKAQRYSYHARERVAVRVLAERQRGTRQYIGTLRFIEAMSEDGLRQLVATKLTAKTTKVEASR